MNKVVHFEVPAEDLERAKKFYADVFGWNIMSVPMGDGMTYEMLITGPMGEDRMPAQKGFINGGMYARKDAHEAPTIVIDVANIDEHLEKITAAGGEIVVPKATVLNMGLYAKVKDTEGNVIGVWQNLPKA